MDWTHLINQVGTPAAFAFIALYLLRDESRRHAAALRELMTACESALRDNAAAISALLERLHADQHHTTTKGE